MEARGFPDFCIPRVVRPSGPPIRDTQEARARTPETDCEQGDRQSRQESAGLSRPIWLVGGIARDRRIRNRDARQGVASRRRRLALQLGRLGSQIIQHRLQYRA